MVAILTALGLKSKVDKLNDSKLEKDVFNIAQKSIDDKFMILMDDQRRIFERLDDIGDYVRNKK